NEKVSSRSSPSTVSSAASTVDASSAVRMPARSRPRTWAREPSRSSKASRRSNGRLTVNASSSSAGPPSKRPCQSVLNSPVLRGLACRPGLDAEAPQLHEPVGVGVVEAVGRVVGRQAVVVEAVLAAPADDVAATRLQLQTDL